MDFSPYQSRGNFAAPNQNYTDPLRVHADHSGGIALARESGRSGLNLWGAALQYKETVDSAKSMEANNEYNRLMSEGTALLMQKKQEQAVNIVDDYDKLHTKVLKQVQKKYKNYIGYGKAAVEFNNYTTRDNATRRSNMLKYQLAETDAFHETQFNNQIAACNQMVLDGGGTDEAIESASNRMAGLVADRYVNYGQEKMKEQERILKGGLVSSALALASSIQDYNRMNEIINSYAKYIDPKAYASVRGMVMKRDREEKELFNGQRMMAELGNHPTYEQIRDYAKNTYFNFYPSESGRTYKGSDADAWKEAQWVQSQTGIPAEYVYRQWAHESAYFSSQLARENNNFGGLTQVEWNGDDNKQPDGNNYYREFNNFHEYAEAYVKDFIDLYKGKEQVHDLASFAHFLKENGYYGADESDYLAAMENVDMEIEGDSEEVSREPSGVQFEAYVDSLVSYAKKQESILDAGINRCLSDGKLGIQDLYNHDVQDESQYNAVIEKCWADSGYNDEVRIKLETEKNKIMKSIERTQEAENRRQAISQRQSSRNQPSAKVTEKEMDYVRKQLSSGQWTVNDIEEYCNYLGVTSKEERNKLLKMNKDYMENKGEWEIPYQMIRKLCGVDQKHYANKETYNNEIDQLARMEYQLMLAENGGRLQDGWESALAKRVADDTTKYAMGGTYKKEGWLFDSEEQRRVPIRDIVAAGYRPIFEQTGDDGYILYKENGEAVYMTGEEFSALAGMSDYIE